MGALLSLLRSDYKRSSSGSKQRASRPATRSTSEQRASSYNSSRERRSFDTGSNSSNGGNNNNNNNNIGEESRSSREVVFPDSFEVLPQPRSDLSVVYMGGVPHEQQRKFRCRFCGKGYRWKSTMRRHEMVECGGKPPAFQCPECPYKARQRGNLTVHYKRHHQKMGTYDESA